MWTIDIAYGQSVGGSTVCLPMIDGLLPCSHVHTDMVMVWSYSDAVMATSTVTLSAHMTH